MSGLTVEERLERLERTATVLRREMGTIQAYLELVVCSGAVLRARVLMLEGVDPEEAYVQARRGFETSEAMERFMVPPVI